MKARDIVKSVGGLVTGAGVGMIIGGACGIAAPVVGVGLLTKGAIAAGSVILASMVEDHATEYFQQKVDDVCDVFTFKKESDENEKEVKES